jgi:adenosylcobinamide kinase/adenosylcobinamide-phosphate guanylyltransferase
MKILLTGGVKSGKSARALQLAKEWNTPVTFIATASIPDDEMKLRVQKHQEERAGLGWDTIEEQVEIDKALRNAGDSVLLDCLPMWLNNIFYYEREHDFETILRECIENMKQKENCAVVTNETGLGNIPFDTVTRRYNLMLSEANKRIAQAFDVVELMVCGLPLRIKG